MPRRRVVLLRLLPVLLPRLHDVAVQRDVLNHGVAVLFRRVVAEVYEQAVRFCQVRLVLRQLPQAKADFHLRAVFNALLVLRERGQGGVYVSVWQPRPLYGRGEDRAGTLRLAREGERNRSAR